MEDSPLTTFPWLSSLGEAVGEPVAFSGEAFNLHFVSPSFFLKVTRPWVRPERSRNEVAMAAALHRIGVPVVRPLVPTVGEFVDEDGRRRYFTVWERLTPTDSPKGADATSTAAEWIRRLWQLRPPAEAGAFQLDDFLHAVHVRLDGSTHPLAQPIIEAVTEVSSHAAYRHPAAAGLIHGDLHSDNLLWTADGLRLIDWESSCVGPLEWDVAQNLRYCPPERLEEQENWWEERGADPLLFRFYFHVRTLSSLSHFVAAGLTPPMYYLGLERLGWADPYSH